ncbi:protein E6-like [Gastrolobium bilobum]|uniref:protein E6-like n=1 Tax=Gastrolobium bilobum TaxID=150636 RepID=UPI002AB1D7CE|nr:protein E6-like [Gastrolobium bilobum]
MAPISKFIPFFFLTTLLLSLQINARGSQFLRNREVLFNNNAKDTEFPINEEPLNKPEQKPVFIPETEKNYDLFSYESRQNPSITTNPSSTYQSYKTESKKDVSNYPNTDFYNFNNDAYTTNQDEVSDTRFAGTHYRNNNNAFNDKFNFNDNDGASNQNQEEFEDAQENFQP